MLLANRGPVSLATWLIAVAALVLAWFAFSAGTAPCAQAAASCAFDDDSIVAGDFTLMSNTAFDVTVGHAATADAVLTIPDTAGVADTFVMTAQTQTLTNKSLTAPTITGAPTAAGSTWADLGSVTTIDINGGSVDGATVGAVSPSSGNFSSGGFTSSLSAVGGGALSGTWTSIGPVTTIDVNGGTIDGATVGAASANTIAGTTIDASTDFTVGSTIVTDGVVTDATGLQIAAVVDLNNNNVNNIGNASTDITSTGATFAAGVPVAINDTSTTTIDSVITATGDAPLTSEGDIGAAGSLVADYGLLWGRLEPGPLGGNVDGSNSDPRIQEYAFGEQSLSDNTAAEIFRIDTDGTDGSVSVFIEATIFAQTGNRSAASSWSGQFALVGIISSSSVNESAVKELSDGSTAVHVGAELDIGNIVVTVANGDDSSQTDVSIDIDVTGTAAGSLTGLEVIMKVTVITMNFAAIPEVTAL